MPNREQLMPHHVLRGVCALAALLGLLLSAGAARADFADCASAGYLSGVDDRMGGVALACDEAVRFSIETPGGRREVRIIYSTADLSSGLLDFVAEIRQGVEQSAATLRRIGEGTTADITIWAAHLAHPSDSLGDIDAQTSPLRGPRSECVIALYPGGNTRFVTAHEFFHCVQFATVGDKTDLSVSTWWVEGSAEWFANLAYPGSGNSAGDVATFDAVSADTALTAMSQESVVFFFWLGEAFGPSMVMALMDAMPSGGGETRQQDALAGLLSEEDFVQFAQAYLDRQIRAPGGAIASSPFPGNIYVYSDSREHRLEADRFVLARFQLEVACGAWSVSREDEHGRWRASKDEGPWRDLPDHIDVSGSDPETWRVAAFAVDNEGFSVDLRLERDPCRQCTEIVVADDGPAACLIGTWNLASGGYGAQIEESLRETGLFETMDYPDMESVLIINSDGTYEMPGPPEGYNAGIRTPEGDLFTGLGTLSMQSGGHWSIDGDRLLLCETGNRVEIDLTLIDPDGNTDHLNEVGGPDSGPILRERTFSCSGGSLTLVEDIPFTPTVTWQYTR